MHSLGRRVIYIEPIGWLRSERWIERLANIGLEWVDYSSYGGYPPNDDLAISGRFAKALLERAFDGGDIALFHRETPGLAGHPRRARALLYDFLARALEEHSQAYALSEHFRAQGYTADIYQQRSAAERLLQKYDVCATRNLCPFSRGGFVAKLALPSVWRGIVWSLVARMQAKMLRAAAENQPSAAKTRPDAIESRAGDVLFFPNIGISYGPLFIKDQYYNEDPLSPFHRDNVRHIELEWMAAGHDREALLRDYERHGVAVSFVDTRASSVMDKLRATWMYYQGGGSGRFARARSLLSAQLLAQVTLRVRSNVEAFTPLRGAKIALLGYDVMFPETAAVALQSLGIRVVAVQERFISTFHTFHSLILDNYLVHGEIVKRRLEQDANAAIERIVVTGDPRSDKISRCHDRASRERQERFSAFVKVCLVLDFHSVRDPFENAKLQGPSWRNNLHFYGAVKCLADDNPDCAFVLRGKNLHWRDVPEMRRARDELDRLDNLFIDDRYDVFDRSYELAAMADVVVARYTSLCDQCLADGIPVLIFEGTVDGSNVVSPWHDYAPYPVEVYDKEALLERFKRIIDDGDYMPQEAFKEMRKLYYARDPDGARADAHDRVQAELARIYDETSYGASYPE